LAVGVAVVGGGAAGLATAIFAARRGLCVTVLDGARTLGAKILVSGGGRCNVTNTRVGAEDFWQKRSPFVRKVLRAFTAGDTVAFFRELGVALHEEPGGKLFPDSNRARSVLQALLDEAARRGVSVASGHRVLAIVKGAAGFSIETSRGPVAAQHVVLATGGLSLPKTGSDGTGYALARSLGHSLVPTSPALAPLVLEGAFHTGLSGIALHVEIAVHVAGRKQADIQGALLFTHFGVSGPAALDASRFWHRARLAGQAVGLLVNLVPPDDFAAAEAWLLGAARERPGAALAKTLAQRLPAAVAAAIPEALEIDPAGVLGRLRREERRRLVKGLTAWPLPIRDSRGYNHAEVTSGGVPLEEVDVGSMQSCRCPGLFLVGEILDADGRIGGFNFQWAWSTAFVAARGLSSASRGNSRRFGAGSGAP
jgi:predicted Rossmann fold flavoprotein